MKTAALFLTTTLPNRLRLVHEALISFQNCIETCTDHFSKKIISVDIFPGQENILPFFDFYKEKYNWTIVSGPCSGYRGMINNIKRGLSQIDDSYDFVFYFEDDIEITSIPLTSTFNKLIDYKTTNNKLLAFICYNTHIHTFQELGESAEKHKYINSSENYFEFNDLYDSDCFLLKNEKILKDEYYINFPVSIFRPSIYKQLLDFACTKYKDIGLEPGLSNAWFDMKFNEKYDIAIYVKNETLDYIGQLDFELMYYFACMQFWNNNVDFRHPSINNRRNTIF